MKRAACCCCSGELPAIRPNKRKLMSVRKQRESWELNVIVNCQPPYTKKTRKEPPSDKQTLRLLTAWQSQKTMFPSIPHGLNLSPVQQTHSQCLILARSKDIASRTTAKTKGSRLGQKYKQRVI